MTLTRDRRTELLAAAPLLATVDADGLERIADRTVEVAFTDGHVIARQGEVGTGFFMIGTGCSRTRRCSSPRPRAPVSGSRRPDDRDTRSGRLLR